MNDDTNFKGLIGAGKRLNLKRRIKFTTLRNEGFKALDLKEDEVIQVEGKKGEDLCIIRQEYLMELLNNSIGSLNSFQAAVNSQIDSQVSKGFANLEDRLVGSVVDSLANSNIDLEELINNSKKNKGGKEDE